MCQLIIQYKNMKLKDYVSNIERLITLTLLH